MSVVRDAVCAFWVREKVPMPWLLPVVAETYDGWPSDTSRDNEARDRRARRRSDPTLVPTAFSAVK